MAYPLGGNPKRGRLRKKSHLTPIKCRTWRSQMRIQDDQDSVTKKLLSHPKEHEDERRRLRRGTSMINCMSDFPISRRCTKKLQEGKEAKNWQKPDVFSYNAIIDTLCKGGLLDQALVLFTEMLHDSNVVPDVVAYTILINGFGNSGRLKEAKSFFDEMVSRGISANLTTYNSMIHGHCVRAQQEEARRYFDEMMDRGISPDTVTFNILVDSHCKDGMTEDAWGLFELMVKINIQPNRITYNSLMDGLCLVGRLQDAVKVFDSMVDKGLEPNEFSWNILIDGCCKNRQLDGAMQLFKKMKQNGLKPTTITYSVLLRGLYRDGRVRAAGNLFNEMQTFGLSLNEVTYATLLDGLCNNGKIDEAVDLFGSLETTGNLINIFMYSILIHGLFQAGKLEDARKLFDKIPRNLELLSCTGAISHPTPWSKSKHLAFYNAEYKCHAAAVYWNSQLQVHAKSSIHQILQICLLDSRYVNFTHCWRRLLMTCAAGYGFIVRRSSGEYMISVACDLGVATNKFAEIIAVLCAGEWAVLNQYHLILKAASGNWEPPWFAVSKLNKICESLTEIELYGETSQLRRVEV
ncbi:pentatricopeptide repeat-containing protein At5g16640, mitochondrial-like [Papaver somniferum]|uniref:pentatricopeptide repeat-containing protein At5g16640, mitochondrial-like n=1 Tax=Papaver somniferum TaxID=3469 RepID=UPI000E6FE3DA|nr:pentatricopeptide repeat-containing protein At5g16640, mitochondrial-like [Papaver somniferum]